MSKKQFIEFKQKAFTLPELMTVLMIVVILITIGFPSFNNFLNNSRQESIISGLNRGFSYARNYSLTNATSTVICPYSGGVGCGSNWNNGWQVTTIKNGSPIVLYSDIFPTQNNLNVLSNPNTLSVSFNNLGLLSTPSTIFNVCDYRGVPYSESIEIFVGGSDQVSVQPGISPSGTALSCG